MSQIFAPPCVNHILWVYAQALLFSNVQYKEAQTSLPSLSLLLQDQNVSMGIRKQLGQTVQDNRTSLSKNRNLVILTESCTEEGSYGRKPDGFVGFK